MIKAILFRILAIVAFISAILYILANQANAKDFGELKELYIDYKNFGYLNSNERNPVIYPTPPSTGLDFGETMDLFWGWSYLDANVESLTDDSQFREVGLEYRIGVKPCKVFGKDVCELGLYHLSEHNLDRDSPSGYYPFQTGLELKVWLFRR